MNTKNERESKIKKKNKKISEWLDNEIHEADSPPSYYLTNNILEDYYKDNDKNILLNDNFKIDELKYFDDNFDNFVVENRYDEIYQNKMIFESNLVQTFKSDNNDFYQFLNPKTPRYHANMLFNQMIDFCIKRNLNDHLGNPLINKMLRNKFYEYCYDNSYIKKI